jgi:hypothetical protein
MGLRLEASMRLQLKNENRIFAKVLYIKADIEVIEKYFSAQRFSSTNSVLSVIPYDESDRATGYELSICVAKEPKG